MKVSIPRAQVVAALRERRFSFQRQAPLVEIYRQQGSGQRVHIPRRDLLPETSVRLILSQAGYTAAQIDKFLRECVKQ